MLNQSKHTDEVSAEASQGKVSGYGGYVARHEYEKSREKKKPMLAILQIVLLLVLLSFSCLGVISLIRGDFLPAAEGEEISGTIKVPTQSELSDNPQDMKAVLAKAELSLITIEVHDSLGTSRYGTGFFVSEDGYAVCSASLVSGEGNEIVAYTSDGVSVSAELKGADPELGIALLRLPQEYQYTPVSVENSFFVERGKKLCAVSSHKAKVFYGTVAEGVVGSVGPAVKVGKDGIYTNIIYVDLAVNQSLYGAAVVDETGAAVGFLTDALPPLHDTLAPVIPINVVYTIINDFLAQS